MYRRNSPKQLTYDEALNKAASYCSLAEKCVADVTAKMETWGVEESFIEKIINQLKADKFIDEQRFAEYYARDKFHFNKWGKVKIAIMLRSKNIDAEKIKNALDSINEHEYEQTVCELLREKTKNLNYKSDYEKQGKLFQFALNRGFEKKTIEAALKTLRYSR